MSGQQPMNATNEGEKPAATADTPAARKLPPAAARALVEAETRRAETLRREADLPKEIGGRGGSDPVRYGDWEVKGMASDF